MAQTGTTCQVGHVVGSLFTEIPIGNLPRSSPDHDANHSPEAGPRAREGRREGLGP